jgi:signal transduction histidine kinase
MVAMPAYPLAVLLSAISFYFASILTFKLASEERLRNRAGALLVVLGGFFLSTFLRTISPSVHIVYLSVLLIYAHAVFLPTLFFDFVSLYCSHSVLRRALLPIAYSSSGLLLLALFRGDLIGAVAPHPYLSYYGVPGPAYRFYLFFVAVFSILPFATLCGAYGLSARHRTRATLFLIISSFLGILSATSTIIPTFFSHARPWPAYVSFLVPSFVLYSLARYHFLTPRLTRPNLLAGFTILATALLIFILLVSIFEFVYFRTYSFYFTGLVFASFACLLILAFVFHPGLTIAMQRPDGDSIAGRLTEYEELASIVAHDIRNDVTLAQIELNRLRKRVEGTGVPTDRAWDRIQHDLKNLFSVSMDLTEYSSSAELISGSDYCLLEQVIQTVQDRIQPYIRSGIRLIYSVPSSLQVCRRPLEVILNNLVDNALKSIQDPTVGVVSITGSVEGDFLSVQVRDNGPGFSKRELERVFKPFIRRAVIGDNDNPPLGSGLGLSIVKRVTELCGGTVVVDSSQGIGTTFDIRIPTRYVRQPTNTGLTPTLDN